jgi:predicted small secreted protein
MIGEEKMKKITLAFVLFLLVALLVSACEINVVTGSGRLITQVRNVSGFTTVTFAGLGELSITQGTTEGLSIEAEDNIMPRILTEVKNGALTISFDRENWQDMVNPTKTIKYTLKVKNLNGLDLSGVGNVTLPKLQVDKLTIKVSGAGGITIGQISASAITCTLSGAGNVDLTGKATSQTITLNGFGNYNGGSLDSSSATVVLTGAGNATVWARETLNVKISGAGSVSYYGSPKVTKDITGVGVLNSQGNK